MEIFLLAPSVLQLAVTSPIPFRTLTTITMRCLWLLLLLLFMFRCVPGCNRAFNKETGLTLHQNRCKIVNAPNPALDASLEALRAQKRLKTSHDRQPATDITPIASEVCQSRCNGPTPCTAVHPVVVYLYLVTRTLVVFLFLVS
jgi:hypothetical protein